MKKTYILAAFITILVFAGIALNWNEINLVYALTTDYPEFLQPFPKEILDSRIEAFVGKDLEEQDLDTLWKLLWIKKEYHKDFYITRTIQEALIRKISLAGSDGLQGTYLRLNLLKYKLGVNNLENLKEVYSDGASFVEENVCTKLEEISNEVDWDDSCSVSHIIEARFFCGMNAEQYEIAAAEHAISQKLGNCVQHCEEHCFEDVPVYVNDCGKAENKNERYHCLTISG